MPPNSSTDLLIRPAALSDIPEILRQRCLMYEDLGYRDAEQLRAMAQAAEAFFIEAIAAASLHAWLAMKADHFVGGGAVIVSPWPAHPYDLENRQATILNVYVYREQRRQGIGRRLMQSMIDWCRRENFFRVSLHASENGRHLYESMGFQPSNEMRLPLR